MASEVRIDCSWVKSEGASLTSSAFKLYCILLSYANKDSMAWPKRDTLRKLMCLNQPRRLSPILEELKSVGLIVPVRHRSGSRIIEWKVIRRKGSFVPLGGEVIFPLVEHGEEE